MTGRGHTMSQEDKERIAQARYGKSYEELDADEKRAVCGPYGGPKGGEALKAMAARVKEPGGPDGGSE